MSASCWERKRKVYFVSDEAMLLHKCEWDKSHIESPERLEKILLFLKRSDILNECEILQPQKADAFDIQLVHSEDYVRLIASTKDMNVKELEEVSASFESIYLNEYSYDAALLSAGCALEALKAVMSEDGSTHKRSFAAIRPPGHHASRNAACGFCIFNNVAICAKKARRSGAERVLIIDWDVHAAQGTQYAIEEDSNIRLLSIHRYEHGTFWPQLPESAIINQYRNTINVPLNSTGCGDAEYLTIINFVVLPVINDFKPSLILVSCGFDAAVGDPEGEMAVTPGGYQWMLHIILEEGQNLNIPVCVLLEGGYFHESVVHGTEFCFRAMLEKPLPNLALRPCKKQILEDLLAVMISHSEEYQSFKLFSDVLNECRKRFRISNDVSIAKFAQEEYRGVREIQFPYPTREEFPPRSETVERDFRNTVKNLISSYSFGRRHCDYRINLLSKEGTVTSDEVGFCNILTNEGVCTREVETFVRNFVCGHYCDICGAHILLILSCGVPKEVRSEEAGNAKNKDATVHTILDALLKIFASGYCATLRELIFDVSL